MKERTTFSRFQETTAARIEKVYKPALQNYLKYRLFGEWPASDKATADILRTEQSHSIVDLYETFISLAQAVVKRADLQHLTKNIGQALDRLVAISDFRLEKLQAHLGSGPIELSTTRSATAGDAFAEGHLKKLTRLATVQKKRRRMATNLPGRRQSTPERLFSQTRGRSVRSRAASPHSCSF